MKYILKKVIALIITLLVISLLTFIAFSLIPGDAALGKLGLHASPEAIEMLRHQLGLDQPVLVRYVKWLAGALHGDFGMSLKYNNTTVMSLIRSRLPVTLILAIMSLVIIVVVSMPLGMISAKYSKKRPDTIINQVPQVTMAITSFFLGIILTYIFGLLLPQ